jgi:hypothetical protein
MAINCSVLAGESHKLLFIWHQFGALFKAAAGDVQGRFIKAQAVYLRKH